MDWKYYRPKFEYEEKFFDLDWPWAGHKNFAYDLVRNIKPKIVVELGTHYGTSFFSFCQAVKDEKMDCELNAIDTWKGDKHADFYGEEVFEKVNEIRDDCYGDLRINLIRKTFDEAVGDFKEESIDILHIDGLHTYEAVKHDFENWLGKMKNSGVVLFHDTAETKDDFGVHILWDELKKKYETMDFFHSHGLGVMFKEKSKFQNISIFREIWQQYYPLLIENRILSTNLDRCETDKDGHFGKLLEEKSTTISNLAANIKQKEEIVREKESEIQQKDQAIQQKNLEMKQKDRAIRQKDTEIRHKDSEIAMMKSSKFWKMRNKYINLKNKLGIK